MTLIDFLKALAKDPEKQEQFKQRRSRKELLEAAELSEADKELLLSDDWERVRAALGGGSDIVPLIYFYNS